MDFLLYASSSSASSSSTSSSFSSSSSSSSVRVDNHRQTKEHLASRPLQAPLWALRGFLVLQLVFWDELKPATLMIHEPHGSGVWVDFRPRAAHTPHTPGPTSYAVMSHSPSACPSSAAASRLLFSFIWLHAGHVRLRVLIAQRPGPSASYCWSGRQGQALA